MLRGIKMKRTNICFSNTCCSWGGGEKWHWLTAKALSSKHNVFLITNSSSKLYHENNGVLPAYQISIGNLSFLNPFKLFKLFLFLKKNNIETVILNLPSDVKTSGIAAKLAGVNKIVYRRGMPKAIRNTFFNKFLFKHIISDVIANSFEIKRSLLKNNTDIFPSSKIKVIYNSVDISLFTQIDYPEKKKIVLGSVGRLVDQKNHHILIPIISELVKENYEVTLKIAGEGELKAKLQSLIDKYSMSEDIILTGFKKDIPLFLEGIDIFLFPSLYEGSANVLVEVMAKGLPTVAFNRSSMPEMVIDNETGLLANTDGEFKSAIIELISSVELRKRLGSNARDLVEKKMNNSKIIDEIERIVL